LIEQFKTYYDPNASVIENQQRLEAFGVELSTGTISTWSHKYYVAPQQTDMPVFNFPPITFEVPSFDNILTDYDVDIPDEPSKVEVSNDYMQVEGFSWWKPEFCWY